MNNRSSGALLRHGEDARAGSRASRSSDRNFASLRPAGHVGCHLCVRVHYYRGRLDAPERHFAGLGQAYPFDGYGRPHRSAGGSETLDCGGHAKVYVALQIATGNRDRNDAGLSACRDGSGQESIRRYVECCRGSIERDCGGAVKSLTKNANRLSDLAGGWQQRCIGRQAGFEAVERAGVVGAACVGVSVQGARGVLEQGDHGKTAVRAIEAVADGKRAAGGDSKDGSITLCPAQVTHTVKIAVCRLYQAAVGSSSIRSGCEGMKDGQRARRGDFEPVAVSDASAVKSRAIEVAVLAEN